MRRDRAISRGRACGDSPHVAKCTSVGECHHADAALVRRWVRGGRDTIAASSDPAVAASAAARDLRYSRRAVATRIALSQRGDAVGKTRGAVESPTTRPARPFKPIAIWLSSVRPRASPRGSLELSTTNARDGGLSRQPQAQGALGVEPRRLPLVAQRDSRGGVAVALNAAASAAAVSLSPPDESSDVTGRFLPLEVGLVDLDMVKVALDPARERARLQPLAAVVADGHEVACLSGPAETDYELAHLFVADDG